MFDIIVELMSILELINYYSVSCKTTIIKIYTTYSRANGRERQSDTTSLTNEMFVSFGADKKKMPTHTWHRPTLFLYLLTMPVGRDQQQHQQSPHHTLKLYTKKKQIASERMQNTESRNRLK